MPTKFPAAPRACVKRARVLRARATAAYIAKKNLTEKKRANFKKNIYILKGCVVCTLYIYYYYIPWLCLKIRYFWENFWSLKSPLFGPKIPPKNLFFSSIFFVCQWKPFFSQLVTTYNNYYYIIRICCPPVSTLFEVVF